MTASELAELYDQADASIVFASLRGFRLTLAEAMLRKLPVIATNSVG